MNTIDGIIAATRYGTAFDQTIRPALAESIKARGLDLSRGDHWLEACDIAHELAWQAEADSLRERPVLVMRDSVGAPPLIATTGTLLGREADMLACVEEPPADLGPIAASAEPFYIDTEPERAAWLIVAAACPPELIPGDLAHDELCAELEAHAGNLLSIANTVRVYGCTIHDRWAHYDAPMLPIHP